MRMYGPAGKRFYGPAGTRLRGNKPAMLDGIATPSPAAYSLRPLRTQYVGPLFKLRRASDNAELDFYVDLLTFRLDLDAIASWAGGDSFCVTWYDQSGNGVDLIETVASRQRIYEINAASGTPAFLFTETQRNQLLSVATLDLPIPFEVLDVWTCTGSSGHHFLFYVDVSGTPVAAYVHNISRNIYLSGGLNLAGVLSVDDGNVHLSSLLINGMSSKIRIDREDDATGDAGANDPGSSIWYMTSGGSPWVGSRMEQIVFAGELSVSDRAMLENSQETYYQ